MVLSRNKVERYHKSTTGDNIVQSRIPFCDKVES